ncbi:hypothetical protein AR689_01505 [Arthrobacter sp. EpRS71]|nr:hypothetical protein AR689_01505 [Arthrobacter sp. EpRS71]
MRPLPFDYDRRAGQGAVRGFKSALCSFLPRQEKCEWVIAIHESSRVLWGGHRPRSEFDG